MSNRYAVLLATLVAFGCSEQDSTQLLVWIGSDYTVPEQIDSLKVSIYPAGADTAATEALAEHEFDLTEAANRLPLSFGVLRPSSVDTIEIKVVGSGKMGSAVTRAETGFISEKVGRVELFLAKHCQEQKLVCNDGDRCGITGCESPEIAQSELEEDDGSTPNYQVPPVRSLRALPTLCGLKEDEWSFRNTMVVENSQTDSFELNPFLAADGNTLYYSRLADGNLASILEATRSHKDAPFGPPTLAPHFALSGVSQATIFLSKDGRQAYFSSKRSSPSSSANPREDYQIWQAYRPNPEQSFGEPSLLRFPDFVEGSHENDPFLSRDGLRLYFNTSEGDVGKQDIVMLERPSLSEPYGAKIYLKNINSATNEDGPTLSADERVIIFSSEKDGGDRVASLYYATRHSLDEDFSVPKPISDLNTKYSESGGPALSWDGCELFFPRADKLVCEGTEPCEWVSSIYYSQVERKN